MSCEHLNSVQFQIEGQQLQKDECTKCFQGAKQEGGVNLCLTCFDGRCPEHTLQHRLLFAHSVYLNIKATEIQLESANDQQITKIAIGKPGGAGQQTTEVIFDTKVICQECDKEIEKTTAIEELIQKILLANSALYNQQVTEWEEEQKPCTHTINLQQQAKEIASKSLAKCVDCELDQNLWLCLTCGNIGCGRRFFDGSGGNNHGVDHTQSSNHPVAVKLGTITPEGTASVHCYDCDLEVLDDNLAAHLASFGIIVYEQVKTEKTVTEMNIDFNLNFHLSRAVEDGRILTKKFGPWYTGMNNLGNSCYMNSIMQVLFAFDDWTSEYMDPSHLDQCEEQHPDQCYYCQMTKLCLGLASGQWSIEKWTTPIEIAQGQFTDSEQYQDGVYPRMFKNLMGQDHREFSSQRQQDASEYFSHIMTLAERAAKRKGLQNPSKSFTIKEAAKLRCNSCQGVAYRKSNSLYLQLPVPVTKEQDVESFKLPWQNVVQAFTTPETVQTFCAKCQTNTNFTKQNTIEVFPNVLVAVMQRFVFPDWVPTKLQCGVDVPTDQTSFEDLRLVKNPGDEELPEESSQQPTFDDGLIVQITSMGFSDLQAKNALLKTGNSNAEAAIQYILENMDDPDLNAPIGGGAPEADSESIVMLSSMGFEADRAALALSKCDGSIERALEWLFSHQDDMDLDQPEEEQGNNQLANYELKACVTHLGKSPHSGHYVCHIKREGEWVLYNDDKVAVSSDPPLDKAYIYFFKRV